MNRRFILSAITMSIFALNAQAQTTDWPKQAIKFVVPFTAGSGTDIVARAVAERLTASIGQTVTIENKPGAGGTIAANQVAKSTPDGYTLLVHSSGHVVNPAIYPNLPYDTIKDLTGITTLASLPNVLVVSPNKGIKDVKDLIAKVKESKRKTRHIQLRIRRNRFSHTHQCRKISRECGYQCGTRSIQRNTRSTH